MYNANLQDAHLINVDLQGANLEDAKVENARFISCNLFGAKQVKLSPKQCDRTIAPNGFIHER